MRWELCTATVCTSIVVAVNALAVVHARAMTRFSSAGTRTKLPEQMSRTEKVTALLMGVNVPRPLNTRTPRDFGMEFETRSVPGAGGRPLEAWIVHASKPRGWVLLLHGYAASKEQVLVAAQRFVAMGFGAVMVDFPGSGGTPGDGTTVGYFEARDVAAAGAWVLGELGSPLVVYGFSMGAAAALRAIAHEGLSPAALVVEAPFDRMLSTVRNRFQAMGVPAFPFAELLVFWGGKLAGFDGFAHNPVDYGAHVTCPTVVLVGEQDPRVRPDEARNIAARMTCRKSLVIVPGTGHEVTATLSDEAWRAVVEPMLPVASRE